MGDPARDRRAWIRSARRVGTADQRAVGRGGAVQRGGGAGGDRGWLRSGTELPRPAWWLDRCDVRRRPPARVSCGELVPCPFDHTSRIDEEGAPIAERAPCMCASPRKCCDLSA